MAGNEKLLPSWSPSDVIADRLHIDHFVTESVINLLEDGATIPFIARYRKEQTKDIEVEKLRAISSLVEELKNVQSKISTVYESIKKVGKMNKTIQHALKNAQSLDEVDSLYAPFKPGHKGTLAERARKLGLEPAALKILYKDTYVDLNKLIKKDEKDLKTFGDVEKGVIHIIADIISKDKITFDQFTKLTCNSNKVMLETHKCKTATKTSDSKSTGVKKEDKKTVGKIKTENKRDDSYKFEQYFDYQIPVPYLKPHQMLAINRGEHKKIITVKIVISDAIKNNFLMFCRNKWSRLINNRECKRIVDASIDDAYDRLILPHGCRLLRSELLKKAEEASVKVFADNLKNLLLQPTVKGKVVLGIDPGFKNGCKSAVISPTGQILETVVFYFHDYTSNKQREKDKVIQTVSKYKCEVIAIGNGVACRETEKLVSDLIQGGQFKPLQVYYSIVDESGASIYSVSTEAEKELPNLDPTLRGAVSISRRLQDPLAELVKIEPKHIGVGMYQHDMSESKLKVSLDSVVEECVSFVGVDLNTGSECLLRRIAGLNTTRAKKIIEWREKNQYFINRQQLLQVKGLGQKSFEQCAGFVRIVGVDSKLKQQSSTGEPAKEEIPTKGRKRKTAATTSKSKKAKLDENLETNPLDMTPIHPESYHIATRLITDVGQDVNDIGQDSFISKFKSYIQTKDVKKLCEKYGSDIHTLNLINDALSKTKCYDIREGNQKPLFKQGITGIEDIKVKSVLTGRVTNVTHFGAFVDIGVGQDALIHSSKMLTSKGRQVLHLGDRVQVSVLNVDLNRKRIALDLIDVM